MADDYQNLKTTLSPEDESNYLKWKATLPDRLQYEGDYDLRGFYKKNPNFSVNDPEQHMTDEFKLPNHKTFSNESKYYNESTKHLGGHWEGDVFIPNDARFKSRVDESGGVNVMEPTNNQFNFAALPDEITGKNGVTPTGVPTHEEIAAEVELQRRKEEARAIAAITARKNGQTAANQQAQTHSPDEGAAANPNAGVPAIPQIPAPSASPDIPATPAKKPVSAPVPVTKKPRQLTDLSTAPLNPLETASKDVDAAGVKLSAASKDVGESEAQAQLDETYARREQATNANVTSALQKLDLQDADQKVAAIREEASKKGFSGYFSGEGGTRRLILSGIATLLGSVSFDSQHVNHVVTQIDNAINTEFNRQTAEKADLWKQVAAAVDQRQMLSKDQLNEMAQFRANQAMALDAVISKGKYLSTLSKNREGIAAVEQNNARLAFERDKAIDESKRLWVASNEAERHHRVDESIERSKVGIEREKALGGGSGPTKADKAFEQIYAKDEALVRGTPRQPGPVARLEAVTALRREIKEAVESKDAGRIKAAIASAREQSTRLLTGAAPTSTTAHLVTELQGSLDSVVSKVSSIAGNPTEGSHFVKNIDKLTAGIEEQNRSILREEKKNQEAKYNAIPFVQRSPEMKKAAQDRINATFDILTRSDSPSQSTRLVPIPDRLKNDPRLAGKTQIEVDASGNVVGAR